jgi:hypothetical protein
MRGMGGQPADTLSTRSRLSCSSYISYIKKDRGHQRPRCPRRFFSVPSESAILTRLEGLAIQRSSSACQHAHTPLLVPAIVALLFYPRGKRVQKRIYETRQNADPEFFEGTAQKGRVKLLKVGDRVRVADATNPLEAVNRIRDDNHGQVVLVLRGGGAYQGGVYQALRVRFTCRHTTRSPDQPPRPAPIVVKSSTASTRMTYFAIL